MPPSSLQPDAFKCRSTEENTLTVSVREEDTGILKEALMNVRLTNLELCF